MRRIIVGGQGSSKTRLSPSLGRKPGLPVIHLDVLYWRPGWLRMWRVLMRSIFERDCRRPDLPEVCPEALDWMLVKEAWKYDAVRTPRIEVERLANGPSVPVVRLRSDREIEAFVEASSPAT